MYKLPCKEIYQKCCYTAGDYNTLGLFSMYVSVCVRVSVSVLHHHPLGESAAPVSGL